MCKTQSLSPNPAAAAAKLFPGFPQAFHEIFHEETEARGQAGGQKYPEHFVVWHGVFLHAKL